jgi:bacillithiol biosynthesis cysteine-adding enzyme BshC
MLIFSSELVLDYIHSSLKTKQFFNAHYKDPHAFQAVAKKVKRPLDPVVQEIFKAQINDLPNSHASREYLQNLSGPLCTIVTGQQAGLFGGPLFTIYKALTTIKLAKKLSAEWNETVLPVFFIAAEDHDYDEIRCLGIVDNENRFQSLCLPEQPDNRKPVADLYLPEETKELSSQLDQMFPDTEYKQTILEKLSDIYTPEKSLSGAFRDWLLYLFSDLGLLVLDGADERLKAASSQILLTELEERTSLTALSNTNEKLTSAGYSIQLSFQKNRPALFYLYNGERHGIEWDPETNRYIHLGTRDYIAMDRLKDVAVLSPKAALRPLVQDTVLPTVAYVGGPGEIAYWAQLKELYEKMNLTMPVVVPRANCTLVEPKVKRHLQRYEIDVENVMKNPDQMIARITNDMIPGYIKIRFDEIKTRLDEFWAELLTDVKEIEPTMKSVVEKGEKGVTRQLDSIEGRLAKAIQKREQTVVQQLQAVVTHLMPQGNLQERQIGLLSYLIKFGPGIINRLYEEIEFPFTEHKFIEL